jgi:hypothetical protein
MGTRLRGYDAAAGISTGSAIFSLALIPKEWRMASMKRFRSWDEPEILPAAQSKRWKGLKLPPHARCRAPDRIAAPPQLPALSRYQIV